MRMSLRNSLDTHGWPLNRQSMERASLQIEKGTPWSLDDCKVLQILYKHGVKTEDMAKIFFEGRTVGDCQAMVNQLKEEFARKPVPSVQGPMRQTSVPVIATPSGAVHSSGFVDRPAAIAVSDLTSFKKRIIEASPAAGLPGPTARPEPNSIWEQGERDIIRKAVQDGLTARQVQAEYLPFRSFFSIMDQMSMERRLREGLTVSNRWSDEDNAILLQLRDQGNSFEAIVPRLSVKRTLFAVEAHYQVLKLQRETDNGKNGVAHVVGDENVGNAKQEAHANDKRDGVSGYFKETSQAKETPTYSAPTTGRETHRSTNSESAKTPQSITTIRTQLVDSIDPQHCSLEDKAELKKALGNDNWPTRFTSIEEYNMDPIRRGARWTDQDKKAILCMVTTIPTLTRKDIAEFFPGRTEEAVGHQVNFTKGVPSSRGGIREKRKAGTL